MLKTLKQFLAVKPTNRATDIGLLILRVGVNVPLFLKHGVEKIVPSSFWAMAPTFPDPTHIGHVPTLLIATVSDAICSLLIVFGLFTRLAGAYIFVILATAWSLTHHFIFFGKGIEPKHGELVVIYMIQGLAFAFLGPGRYSLDRLLWGDKTS